LVSLPAAIIAPLAPAVEARCVVVAGLVVVAQVPDIGGVVGVSSRLPRESATNRPLTRLVVCLPGDA